MDAWLGAVRCSALALAIIRTSHKETFLLLFLKAGDR